MILKLKWISLVFFFFCISENIKAHHFKGLPHYGYFENYPQTPVDEYLGQAGDFEFFLVIYDFQGFQKEEVERPDDIRLFLNVYNLREDKAYSGPLVMEIYDEERMLVKVPKDSSEQESLYYFNRVLPQSGHYSLRVRVLHGDGKETLGVIPFKLSSQKISWGKWLILGLITLVGFVAFGSRKARIKKDRQENKKREVAGKK